MKIYDFGHWIRVRYWNNVVKYLKNLPKDLSNINSTRYFYNGLIHREDGPAFTTYYKNGTFYNKIYYLNGEIHREDGPAETFYFTDSSTEVEYYYLHGKRLTKKEWEKQVAAL